MEHVNSSFRVAEGLRLYFTRSAISMWGSLMHVAVMVWTNPGHAQAHTNAGTYTKQPL
jgi:hypothetical protein